jgi:hypothetical protein
LDVDRAGDVTPALLGASRRQAQAFRSAGFGSGLRGERPARDASDAIWAGGNWRAVTAEAAAAPLDLAARLTGEGEREGDAPGAARSVPAGASPAPDPAPAWHPPASPGPGGAPGAAWGILQAEGGPTVILQELCAARGLTPTPLAVTRHGAAPAGGRP